MAIAVRTQADDYAKARYMEMQAGRFATVQPEGELRGKPPSHVSMGSGLQPGQQSECGTVSSAAEAAAATLETTVAVAANRQAEATPPEEDEGGASAEMTAVHTCTS